MQDWMIMGGPMMVMMFIIMLLVLAALIAGVMWLVRALAQDGRSSHKRSAIDQLEMRYARGDIDRDEYFERREDLERA